MPKALWTNQLKMPHKFNQLRKFKKVSNAKSQVSKTRPSSSKTVPATSTTTSCANQETSAWPQSPLSLHINNATVSTLVLSWWRTYLLKMIWFTSTMRIRPILIRIWEEHKVWLKAWWLTIPSELLKMKLMRRSSYPIAKATLKDHATTTSPKPKPKAHQPKVEVENRVKT